MNNDELRELRKLLSNYTEHNLKKAQLKKNEDISKLELVNFIDRANRVVYDIERLMEINDGDKV